VPVEAAGKGWGGGASAHPGEVLTREGQAMIPDPEQRQDSTRRRRLADHENVGRRETDLDDRLAEGFDLLDDEDRDETFVDRLTNQEDADERT
jgi:hypothetical protein